MSHKHGWYELNYSETFDLSFDKINDTVDRIDVTTMSEYDFINKYERHYIPVVIKNAQLDWLALKKWTKSVSDTEN